MWGNKRSPHALLSVVAGLALIADVSETSLAQEPAAPSRTRAKRSQAKRSVAKTTPRPKGGNASDTAADRITLRDGKELLGQVVESSNNGLLTILARREMVRKTLPSWATTWEDAEKHVNALAVKQRRERLAGWRSERPDVAVPGDRITAWLDRELARSAETIAPSRLMVIRLDSKDVSAVERRSDLAAQALRAAWILGLGDPEKTPLRTLRDAIAAHGMVIENGNPIAVDRLLPPSPSARTTGCCAGRQPRFSMTRDYDLSVSAIPSFPNRRPGSPSIRRRGSNWQKAQSATSSECGGLMHCI